MSVVCLTIVDYMKNNLYSRVFLLAEGRVAFSGPIPDAIEFFKRQVLRYIDLHFVIQSI